MRILGWKTGLLIAIVLVACGGRGSSGPGSASPDGGPIEGDAATGAGLLEAGDASAEAAVDAALDPACAPTYPAPEGNCKVGTTCRYPEGTCLCAQVCSGAPPPDDVDTSQWYCTPKRTDGCPDEPPTAGAPCTGRSTCNYGHCCITRMACDGATWSSRIEFCPP